MGEKNRLGEELRRFRRERKLSGTELAANVGVTQGTISKIEHGSLVPDLDFLSKFAHTLRLKEDEATNLMRLAGVLPGGVTPERALQYLPVDFLQVDWSERRQVTLAMTEARSSHIRVFNPLFVPGLLQTERYAAHIIEAAGVRGDRQIKQAVRARLRRQHILNSPEKQVTFIIMESALLARLAPTDVLVEQMRRLRQIACSARLHFALIPPTAPLRVVPPPAFYLFDRRVYIELPHGDLWLLSRSNAFHVYRRLFDELSRLALRGSELIAKLDQLLNQLR
jgi:transcriptional regulator with XRE-family HTH domain